MTKMNDPETIEIHNALYQGAGDLIEPYLVSHIQTGGRASVQTMADKAKLSRACEMYQRVIELNPANWNALWCLGMARRLLDQRQAAYEAFRAAYSLAGRQIEVGRNFAMECIALGRGSEAVEVTAAMVQLSPSDPGLVANLGLALLINDRVEEAASVVEQAYRLDINDVVTRDLRNLVQAVQRHSVQRPVKWPLD
jgi:Flp pilus assembly protein TadD